MSQPIQREVLLVVNGAAIGFTLCAFAVKDNGIAMFSIIFSTLLTLYFLTHKETLR